MKIIGNLFILVFLLSIGNLSAQTFEFAGTYTSSSAEFYRNTPGLRLAYSHDLKRQFVFLELKASKKNKNSYTEYAHYWPEDYNIRIKEGEFSVASIGVGIAQKLITTDYIQFSTGLNIGLNYFKLENKVKNLIFDPRMNGSISYENEYETRNNKFGFGLFVDMELKRIVMKNLSLFSRVEIYQSDYLNGPMQRGISFQTRLINSISFSLGLKYRMKTNP